MHRTNLNFAQRYRKPPSGKERRALAYLFFFFCFKDIIPNAKSIQEMYVAELGIIITFFLKADLTIPRHPEAYAVIVYFGRPKSDASLPHL